MNAVAAHRWLGLAALMLVCLGFEGRMSGQGTKMDANSDRIEAATRAAVDRFNQAFNQHDADLLGSLMTEDTVFENTSPPPDGERIQGKAAVLAYWRTWFARNPDALFETEEIIVSGNRAIVRWVYRKRRGGQPWHLRGIDVFTVRDGKIAAKLAYVKG